jgi:hypothetical protein
VRLLSMESHGKIDIVNQFVQVSLANFNFETESR